MARRALIVGSIAAALTLWPGAAAPADFTQAGGWGSPGAGDGQFATASGIAVGPTGSVYVADLAANRVQRFDALGTFLGTFGSPGSGPGQFAGASHVAADPFGSIYVTDRDNARVQKLTADGTYVAEWGTRGTGDGQFQEPTGVATDSRGNVYVADRQRNVIQRFTSDGAYDLAWGGTGTGDGRFLAAEDVAVDPFGDVYVLDGGANVVQKFTADGAHLLTWGGPGAGDGQLTGPLGVASDPAGNLFVADTGNGRVQQFAPDGTFVTLVGAPGQQFASPVDVAADAAGAVYVVDRAVAGVRRLAQPDPPLPPPEAGRTANIERVAGVVLVRRPGALRFTRVRKPEQIPIGSQVQTTKGRARLTTAKDLGGGLQAATFRAGLFAIAQRREPHPVTVLRLVGAPIPRCAPRRRSAQTARRRPRRSLWGDGKGSFRTDGRYGSAGVRGTIWLTQDRCDGTLIRVRRGTVRVRDDVRDRTIVLTAGRSYLARRRP